MEFKKITRTIVDENTDTKTFMQMVAKDLDHTDKWAKDKTKELVKEGVTNVQQLKQFMLTMKFVKMNYPFGVVNAIKAKTCNGHLY